MAEAPWGGYFSGYQRRGFHFGVNDEALCEIYLIDQQRQRVGQSRKVKIYAGVMVELEDGKRLVKALKNDVGYHSNQKPGLDHKAVKLTAMTVGEAMVEISIRYQGNEVVMDGKVLQRGSLKDGKLSFQYEVRVPAMYTNTYLDDPKKEKARMKRDRIKFTRLKDDKKISLKSYQEVDLAESAEGGVSVLEVSMDGQHRRTFEFSTLKRGGGLAFENKNPGEAGKLWQGYRVIWRNPQDGEPSAPLVIGIK